LEVSGIRNAGDAYSVIDHLVIRSCGLEVGLAAARIIEIGGHGDVEVLDQVATEATDVGCGECEIVWKFVLHSQVEGFGVRGFLLVVDAVVEGEWIVAWGIWERQRSGGSLHGRNAVVTGEARVGVDIGEGFEVGLGEGEQRLGLD
jgi:hypothetical protein